jgi:hypothetical protein
MSQEIKKKQLNKDLENRFTYHKPTEKQAEKYEMLRSMIKQAAYMVTDLVPEGREKALALTKLEEAVMWANAGIAREGGEQNVKGEKA